MCTKLAVGVYVAPNTAVHPPPWVHPAKLFARARNLGDLLPPGTVYLLPVDDPQREAGGGSHGERLLRPIFLVGRVFSRREEERGRGGRRFRVFAVSTQDIGCQMPTMPQCHLETEPQPHTTTAARNILG